MKLMQMFRHTIKGTITHETYATSVIVRFSMADD